VSSQDYSPAPYPAYAGFGAGETQPEVSFRTRERYWLYGLLFALTLVTATVVGAAMQYDFDRNLPFDIEHSFTLWERIWRHPAAMLAGLPYSLTLLAILMAHEMGHYLAALYHRVDASLPYFMPSPFLGTFGAFIRVRSPIYSKRELFDIGVAGPLAGFIFLLPALAIGLAFSKVIPGIQPQSSLQFGTPPLQWLMQQAIFPGVAAANLYLHPVARAAWVGMFATCMNLLPIGQLDGGHILYSFFPQRHRTVSKMLCIALLPLGKLWLGWLVWGLILLWLGRRHPVILDAGDVGLGRRKLGWIALVIFLLCFTFQPIGGPG
jgi:membrane-associated protease RseP (regulator of RpoE activity)